MKSGINAMGLVVPSHRLQKAYKAVQEMLPEVDKATAFLIAGKAANLVERDEPYEIVGRTPNGGLDTDIGVLDLTGRYRLLATLLTD